MINLIKITAVSGIVIASLSTANATVNDENSVFPINDLNRDVLFITHHLMPMIIMNSSSTMAASAQKHIDQELSMFVRTFVAMAPL